MSGSTRPGVQELEKKMKNSVAKLFWETLLRAAVIILGIGIVAMSILLGITIKKNNDNKAKKEANTEIKTDVSTEETDTTDPTFYENTEEASSEDTEQTVSSKDAKILVVNATGVNGVAGKWKTSLESEGYSSVDTATYNARNLTKTTICVSGSYDGADLAGMFSEADMSTTDQVSDTMTDASDISSYDIIILIGTDDVK